MEQEMDSPRTSSQDNITEIEGDLFDAPDGAVLIHACNCYGSWGAGIAKAFMDRYPAAFDIYHSYCRRLLASPKYATHSLSDQDTRGATKRRRVQHPLGTALIIPPQEDDYSPRVVQPTPGQGRRTRSQTKEEEGSEKDRTVESWPKKKHWIVCLFTSRNFGRGLSPQHVILQNTRWAVEDMKRQLELLRDNSQSAVQAPGDLWSCRFNSGLFGVKWEDTRKILEESGLEITVVRPEGEKY